MMSRRALVHRLLAAGSVPAAMLPARRSTAQPRTPVAPEFVGIDAWINTDAALSIEMLRGKVVLVDFWTYSCINCRRTVPYLNRWQAEYGAHGLQVVGIHTPEFGFERMRHNVADSVREFGIRFPVGQDNGFRTWRAWSNQAWPAFYLIDRSGRIVLVREGEGHAREMEQGIQALLGLPPSGSMAQGDDPDLSDIGTEEIYFGALHPTPQDRAQHPMRGTATYTLPGSGPRPGEYQLGGTWERQDEALALRSPQGVVRVRFSAAKLHLVALAPQPSLLRVTVDGEDARVIEVEKPTLYTLFDGTSYTDRVLTVETATEGLSLFSATFG